MNRIATIAVIATLALLPVSADAMSSHGRRGDERHNPHADSAPGLSTDVPPGYVGGVGGGRYHGKPVSVPEAGTLTMLALGAGLVGAAAAGRWLTRSKRPTSIARDRIDEAGDQLATPDSR